MYGGFAWGFRVPGKRAVRELNPPPLTSQRAEQRGHWLALSNRVSGHVGELAATLGQQAHGLGVPAGHVVQITVVISSPDSFHVLGLLFSLGELADKRRIAEQVGRSAGLWHNLRPVHA